MCGINEHLHVPIATKSSLTFVAVFALVFGGKKTAAVATKGVKGKK